MESNATYGQGTRSKIVTRTLTEFQGDQKLLMSLAHPNDSAPVRGRASKQQSEISR